MKLDIFIERINLFGFTWGTILNAAFALSGTAQYHFGYPYPSGDYAPTRLVPNLLLCELVFVCFGVALAVPFALAFGLIESEDSPECKSTPLDAVRLCALGCLPLLLWFVLWPGSEYGPDGWFSGGLRLGLVGYVAALVAGYVAAKPRASVKAKNNRPRLAVVLAVELVLVIVLVSSALFPTPQKVRGSELVVTHDSAKTNF